MTVLAVEDVCDMVSDCDVLRTDLGVGTGRFLAGLFLLLLDMGDCVNARRGWLPLLGPWTDRLSSSIDNWDA